MLDVYRAVLVALVALSSGLALGLIFALIGLFTCESKLRELEAREGKRRKRPTLEYEAVGIPPELEWAYRRLHPDAVRLDDFVRAALANPDYRHLHERLRTDFRRLAVRHVGQLVMITVKGI